MGVRAVEGGTGAAGLAATLAVFLADAPGAPGALGAAAPDGFGSTGLPEWASAMAGEALTRGGGTTPASAGATAGPTAGIEGSDCPSQICVNLLLGLSSPCLFLRASVSPW